MKKSVRISEELEPQIRKIEESIEYWSIEHSQAVLEVRRIERQLMGMYDARMEVLLGFLASQVGMPASKIKITGVDEAGFIEFEVEDPAESEAES